jgi:hypothetical protein
MRRHTRRASNAQDADARTCELHAGAPKRRVCALLQDRRSQQDWSVGYLVAGSVCWAFAEVAGEA